LRDGIRSSLRCLTNGRGTLPAKIIIIDLDQREWLYELVRNHLGSIEDFWLAMERTKDFDTAERLGLEFAEDFRLLRDIGWSEYDMRPRFELTMPPLDLTELLLRLKSEAAGMLLATVDDRREDAESDRGYQLGYEACTRVLGELDSGSEGSS
jgi:hypothetical protein